MVEWSASSAEVCGYGDRDRVTLAVDDWRPGGRPPTLDGPADAVVVGTASGVRLPPGEVDRSGAAADLADGPLTDGPHELVVDAALETRVTFAGPAAVETAAGGRWLRFPDRTAVAIGVAESLPPRETVTVPPTPDGAAAAVTAAARTHRTDGPARSHPGFRPRTPRVTLEPDADVEVAPDPDRPTLSVPARTVAVLVAAPLAYYLGADLETGADVPTLTADGLEHTFDPLPGFADEVDRALRGLCGLDVRLRDVPGETGPLEADVDASDRLRDAAPTERLQAVLDGPPAFPETWPLVTYVDDDAVNVRYLPHLLDDLSLVHPAEASSLDPRALLKRSLDEFFRGETPSVDTVDPALAEGRYHAWRGDGTPIDAYTLLGRREPPNRGAVDVAVVCNDPDMRSEESVASIYRDRLADQCVDVEVHDRLTTGELSSLFERSTDLVHFIGHCEVDGLVCPDGHLAAADLEACGTDAFVLNACGSFHEGYDLVRRGANVGCVTLTTVLDEQAMTVGTTLSALLAAGFAFARAVTLARGEILAGRDYVVVGDGTRRLREPRGAAGVFGLERTTDGFRVGWDATTPDAAGRRTRTPLPAGERVRGTTTPATLAPGALRDLFERYRAPVRFEGSLTWTDDLLETLPEL